MLNEDLKNGKYVVTDEIGDTLLVIEQLKENVYRAKNKQFEITAEIKPINDYVTSVKCIENKRVDKNGRLRKTNKLAEHSTKWLEWMLEEKGFIRKPKCK